MLAAGSVDLQLGALVVGGLEGEAAQHGARLQPAEVVEQMEQISVRRVELFRRQPVGAPIELVQVTQTELLVHFRRAGSGPASVRRGGRSGAGRHRHTPSGGSSRCWPRDEVGQPEAAPRLVLVEQHLVASPEVLWNVRIVAGRHGGQLLDGEPLQGLAAGACRAGVCPGGCRLGCSTVGLDRAEAGRDDEDDKGERKGLSLNSTSCSCLALLEIFQ